MQIDNEFIVTKKPTEKEYSFKIIVQGLDFLISEIKKSGYQLDKDKVTASHQYLSGVLKTLEKYMT